MYRITNLITLTILTVAASTLSMGAPSAQMMSAKHNNDSGLLSTAVVDLDFWIDPLPLQPSQQAVVNVMLSGRQRDGCYGIPTDPVDIVLMLDNSLDSGSSDLQGLKDVAHSFLQQSNDSDSSKQDKHSRFTIMTVKETLSDVTIPKQNVSASDASLFLHDLVTYDGTFDLGTAVEKAAKHLSEGKQNARHAIVIFSNNPNLLTETAVSALNTVSTTKFNNDKRGIDVAFVSVSAVGSRVISQSVIDQYSPASKFLVDPSLIDLRRLFVDLSRGASTWLARDISLTIATMPVDALQVIQVSDNTMIVSGQVYWKEDHLLPNQQLTLHFSAVVSPQLSTKEALAITDLSYIDCNGIRNAVQSIFPLPVGSEGSSSQGLTPSAELWIVTPALIQPPHPNDLPKLPQSFLSPIDWMAILPFLKWIGIILLSLMVIYLIWKYFPRSHTPPKKAIHEKVMLKEVLDPIPAWFKALTARKSNELPDNTDTLDFQETILIGLGSAGRIVLSRLATDMNMRFGDRWRSKIHILQIDVNLQKPDKKVDWRTPNGFKESEWLLLQPQLQEIKEHVQGRPQDWKYLSWFEKTAPAYPRSQGRMALFWDLRDGPRTSKFWRAVELAYQSLSKPLIRVVATTFDDIGSGILADVAYLVKQGIVQRDADVELWLLGPSDTDWLDPINDIRVSKSEQYARTLATLRELERFQRNSKVTFTYVPDSSSYTQLNQSYEYAIAPTIFMFDPAAKQLSSIESMQEMSTALASLAYRRAALALTEHISHNRLRASGQSVVCGLGIHEMRTTNRLVEESISWRMVQDVLFEKTLGILPIEQLTSDGNYETLDSFVPLPSLNVTKEQDDIKKWINYAIQSSSQGELYKNVASRLSQILNGEPASLQNSVKDRRLAIEKGQRWLKLLDGTSRMYPELQMGSKIRELQSRLDDLRDWMQTDVASLAKQRWLDAREQLKTLLSASQTDLSTDLDWMPYKQTILLSERDSERHADQSPLLKLASRFGWFVYYDEDQRKWKINLVVPPLEFGWHEGSQPDQYLDTGSADRFLDSLYAISATLARFGPGHSAVEHAASMNVSDWVDRARPMLRYGDWEATKLTGSTDSLYILGLSESSAPQAASEIVKKFHQIPMQVVDTNDRDVVHLMHVVNWIPLEALDMYKDEQWQMHTVLPGHYVWSLEQWAAEIESAGFDRLSVAFLSRYNEDQEFMTAFGLGLIYDLFICREDGTWLIPFPNEDGIKSMAPERNSQLGSSFLSMFFDLGEYVISRRDCVKIWNKSIQDHQQMSNDSAYEFFRDVQRQKIPVYLQADRFNSRAERDLGIFLTHLLEAERKKLHLSS